MSQNIPQRAQTQPPKPKRAPRSRWDRIWFWLRACLIVSLLPVPFVVAAAVMMIDRDITAPSWVTSRIEARAAELTGDASLAFGAMTVRIGRDLHPRVRLNDTTLIGADGTTLTRIPIIEGMISPRGLVLQQDILMQEISVVGAQFNLRRASNGNLSFAFSAGGNDLGEAQTLIALLEQFDEIFERPALEALEIVRAEGLVLNFDDARAGRSWVVDGGAATLDLRGGQTDIHGDFSLLSGRADPTRVQLSYTSPRGSMAAQVGLSISDAIAADLATQSPAFSVLRGVTAPITADLRTNLDGDGALGDLNARLDLGAGAFQPNPGSPAVGFENARAYFTFDPARNALAISEMVVLTEWGEFAANGTAVLQDFQNGLPATVMSQMQLRDITFSPPGLFDTSPQIAGAFVDFRTRFDPFEVEIGQLVLDNPETRLVAQGSVGATDTGWTLDLDAQLDAIRPEDFVGYWPLTMKPRSRNWVATNLTKGRLRDVTAAFRIRPDQPARFALGFGFSDMQINALRTLPPIEAAFGVGRIVDNQLDVTLDAGVARPPQGGLIDLAGSHFTIADLRMKPSPALLDLRMESALTASLSALNLPPFSFMDKANLPVTVADARAVSRTRIAWPLMPRPPGETVIMETTATLQNLRSTNLLEGHQFSSPELQVTANRKSLNIAGPIQIGDARALAVWEQRFGDPNRPGSRVLAQVTLNQDTLDEFDIALPQGTVRGEGVGEFALNLLKDQSPQFSLRSDLRGLRIAVPAAGWVKGPETAGDLQITGSLGAVPQIDVLRLSGPGLSVTGGITLDPQGGLAEARFSRVQVGDWLDAPVTLSARGQGQPVAVAINGGSLDLRRAPFGDGQGGGGPLTVALDWLQVSDGIGLTGLRGDFRTQGGLRGDFDGSLNGDARVTGTIAPRAGRTAVRLRSDDAGAVLRAAGLMETAFGGALDLTLLPSGGTGDFDGALNMRDIRVRDAPAIAALLDAISVVGLLQQLDGQGLAFDDVNVAFRLTPEQVIVSQASAVGAGLGISADGIYTLGAKTIDFQGVVSPFFLVNSIGSFLTRRGEGLIGFSYTVAGTADTPDVSVNPLSVLTPGMFREIFRRPAPDISQ